MAFLISWAVVTVSLWAAAQLLDGMSIKGGIVGHFLTSAIFGLLNVFVGWLFFLLLGVLTGGLGFVYAFVTRLGVTAILLKVTGMFSSRLTVKGFGTALIAALIMSVVSGLTEHVLHLLHVG